MLWAHLCKSDISSQWTTAISYFLLYLEAILRKNIIFNDFWKQVKSKEIKTKIDTSYCLLGKNLHKLLENSWWINFTISVQRLLWRQSHINKWWMHPLPPHNKCVHVIDTKKESPYQWVWENCFWRLSISLLFPYWRLPKWRKRLVSWNCNLY